MREITLLSAPESGALTTITGSAAPRLTLAAMRRGRPARSRAGSPVTLAACQGHARRTEVVMLVERRATFRFPHYPRSLQTELEVPALKSPEPSPARGSSRCVDFDCPLSKRELEVVKLISTGMTNRQIATKLFIAERTAEGHVERIRNKLDVRSRTEVAVWAARHGLDEN
jgi:DNA-binding NarL/FixJ family response regulator